MVYWSLQQTDERRRDSEDQRHFSGGKTNPFV